MKRAVSVALLSCAVLVVGCADSPVEPTLFSAQPTVDEAALSNVVQRFAERRQSRNGIERRRNFVNSLQHCDAFERTADGLIRLVQFPIPGRSFADGAPQQVRVVAVRLSDRANPPIAVHCGIPIEADAQSYLRRLRYDEVRARLDGSLAIKLSDDELHALRVRLSIAAFAEGLANSSAWKERTLAPKLTALFGPVASLTDCPLNGLPSQGCTSLGGITIVADALPPHGGVGFDTYLFGDGWEGFYARSQEILLEYQNEQCELVGCDGDGAIPPDAVAAACPRDTSPPSGNWPYPVYATDPTTPISTCSGAGTEGCLYSKPGVWIGSAQISPFLGSLRHTATLVVNNNGIKITELQISGAQDTIFFERPVPASHGIEDFIWVRVASPAWFDAVRSAALRATWEYTDRIYFGDSGRFTSSILKAAGIVLSKEQQAALGNSPGICWCFTCLQP